MVMLYIKVETDLPLNEIKLELGLLSLFYDSILMY